MEFVYKETTTLLLLLDFKHLKKNLWLTSGYISPQVTAHN